MPQLPLIAFRFDAALYLRYRPTYPRVAFESFLRSLLGRPGRSQSVQQEPKNQSALRLLDLGCGTGAALEAAMNALRSLSATEVPRPNPMAIEWVGVDLDPEMLAHARARQPEVRWYAGNSEAIPLPDGSVDGAWVASAWHWMDPFRTSAELVRVLRPAAPLLILEYQAPIAIGCPELNQWSKKEFNLNWKAPNQRPRGRLKQLCAPLLAAGFKLYQESTPEMIVNHDVDSYLGELLSQSRVQHYLAAHPQEAPSLIELYRQQIATFFGAQHTFRFDYRLRTLWYQR